MRVAGEGVGGRQILLTVQRVHFEPGQFYPLQLLADIRQFFFGAVFLRHTVSNSLCPSTIPGAEHTAEEKIAFRLAENGAFALHILQHPHGWGDVVACRKVRRTSQDDLLFHLSGDYRVREAVVLFEPDIPEILEQPLELSKLPVLTAVMDRSGEAAGKQLFALRLMPGEIITHEGLGLSNLGADGNAPACLDIVVGLIGRPGLTAHDMPPICMGFCS